jgi:hypothetical protein
VKTRPGYRRPLADPTDDPTIRPCRAAPGGPYFTPIRSGTACRTRHYKIIRLESGDNDAVRAYSPPRRALRGTLLGTLAITCLGAPAGCGSDPPSVPVAEPSATGVPAAPTEARTQLAARAAAAKDLRSVAFYRLSSANRTDRTVVVTRAADGSWRVDIPGGALGGTADVAVARTRAGLFQCALSPAGDVASPACVRVAAPDGRLASAIDPLVQHVFVDWLDVLTDRRAAIAVSTTSRLAGVRGTCFAVESNSASLAAPLDVGIYCFDPDGTLTGARLGLGTLVLTGRPNPPPPAVTLPGPTVDARPLPMASPPPSPTPEATAASG